MMHMGKVLMGVDQPPQKKYSQGRDGVCVWKQHKLEGLEVTVQQDMSVAAPSSIRAFCKKLEVTSHGTFSHFLQTS